MNSEVSNDDLAQQPIAQQGEHVAPALGVGAFHCMHCGVLTSQDWTRLWAGGDINYYQCSCANCHKTSIWKGEPGSRSIDPIIGGGPRPHLEMPADVLADYEEALTIVGLSPRGACALLRLAVQKLCKGLGESGDNINADIASLVRKGLTVDVQEALDSLRVIGNSAVHPGELDLRDDPETASALFNLINFIVDDQIAQPKKRKAIFEKLPTKAREAIKARDGK